MIDLNSLYQKLHLSVTKSNLSITCNGFASIIFFISLGFRFLLQRKETTFMLFGILFYAVTCINQTKYLIALNKQEMKMQGD